MGTRRILDDGSQDLYFWCYLTFFYGCTRDSVHCLLIASGMGLDSKGKVVTCDRGDTGYSKQLHRGLNAFMTFAFNFTAVGVVSSITPLFPTGKHLVLAFIFIEPQLACFVSLICDLIY